MEVVPVQCGPPVNESERKALERIKARLIAEPGNDLWLLLSNLTFSTTHLRQSDEIDIVAIGPPGAQVIEVKHWTETWVKRNRAIVEGEAERVSEKARKIGTTLREHVENLPRVDGVFLVTQLASKVAAIRRLSPIRGIPFHTLKSCDDAVGLYAKKVLTRDDIRKLGEALEPKSAVAVDGTLKQMASYRNLVLRTPAGQRFHRVYDAKHSSLQERVKLHLYDLSASDDPMAEQKAEREWKSLNKLYVFTWAPRIVDSFQDAPGYPGEIKFFTTADYAAPSIEERAVDASWDADARLSFARDTVKALRELHESNPNGEGVMLHRNLTPRTILVNHDNSPVLTGFEHARIPTDVTVAIPDASMEWEDQVAPEIRTLGRGAADQRSDVFSLCASLSLLFKSTDGDSVAEIAEILTSGTEHDPNKRISLPELEGSLSERLGESVPELPPSPARFWAEGQIVQFGEDSYKIISNLGSGGVGTTFKVTKFDRETQEEFGTYVAKVVHDKETGKRVLGAYRLAHPHLHHSSLSIIFEVAPKWQENNFLALMTWIEGEPIGEYIGLLPLLAEDLQEESSEALALRWLRSACEALLVLHNKNLIHGDVSPRNMIVSDTELVLTDYDCVTSIGAPASSPGTVSYCSLSYQQCLNAAPSDDLFALAASFFHVLFEREPFWHDGALAKERGLNWDGLDYQIYPKLHVFLNRATDPDPAKRFASVESALSTLIPLNASSAAGKAAQNASVGIAEIRGSTPTDSESKTETMGRRKCSDSQGAASLPKGEQNENSSLVTSRAAIISSRNKEGSGEKKLAPLEPKKSDFSSHAVSPFQEMGAYEFLWTKPKTTFESLSELFARHPGSMPSDFVGQQEALECAEFVKQRFTEAGIKQFGVRVHGDGEYPERLRDATHPVEVFYYQGRWELAASRTVAIIGTRNPTRNGLARTLRLVRELVTDKFTVVSSLAAGVDRKVHEVAMENDGRTIALIGTPLSHSYPKENARLQRALAENFLVVSQVPVKRYESQDYRLNRKYFPERSMLLPALTEATIIVEAGENSETLLQARSALAQKRKLLVLDSNFRNSRLSWPGKLAEKGAIRVSTYDDIRQQLSQTTHRVRARK